METALRQVREGRVDVRNSAKVRKFRANKKVKKILNECPLNLFDIFHDEQCIGDMACNLLKTFDKEIGIREVLKINGIYLHENSGKKQLGVLFLINGYQYGSVKDCGSDDESDAINYLIKDMCEIIIDSLEGEPDSQ